MPGAKEGFVTVDEGLRHLLTQYAAFDTASEDVRAAMEDLDAVTHDMIVHVLEVSQKQQWMIRSHLA